MANSGDERTFRSGLIAILFCMTLCVVMVVLFIIPIVQYHRLVADMKPLEATVVDTALDLHAR